MMDINSISRIKSYINNNENEWQNVYLPLLSIVEEYKDDIEIKWLDYIIKNMQLLILRSKDESIESTNEELFSRLAFYNTYILKVGETLNKAGRGRYYFILFPCLSDDVGVVEIFRKKEESGSINILGIQFPEQLLLDKETETNNIILCHEIAHYVGSSLRKRDIRLNALFSIYARIIVLGLRTLLLQEKICFCTDENLWNKQEQKLCQWIEVYYNRIDNIDYIKAIGTTQNVDDTVKYNKDNKQHMFFAAPALSDCIREMFQYSSREVFETLISESSWDCSYDEAFDCIDRCLEKMTRLLHKNNYYFSISGAFHYAQYLLKEAYADIMSILLLNLPPHEYYECLLKQYGNDDAESAGMKVCARLAIVTHVMCRPASGVFTWSDNEIMDYDVNNHNLDVLVQKMLTYASDYMVHTSVFDANNNELNSLSCLVYKILEDSTIIKRIDDYLYECRAAFCRYIDKSDVSQLISF